MIPGGFVGLSWSFRRHREHFTFELSVDGGPRLPFWVNEQAGKVACRAQRLGYVFSHEHRRTTQTSIGRKDEDHRGVVGRCGGG